jgi:hypothetical protein
MAKSLHATLGESEVGESEVGEWRIENGKFVQVQQYLH